MNSFSHALPFLDDPYMAIGCSLPDWLGAADRRVRVREQAAAKFLDHEDRRVASLARGIVQHHQDDRWFHQTQAFTELSMQLAVESRELLEGEPGFRPGLLGHIIIELMLDAYLHETLDGRLERFYEIVADANAELVEQTVNEISKRSTDQLVPYFQIFLRERYLFDYSENDRLMYRMNRVFMRIKLEPIGSEIDDWLPSVRERVYDRVTELLPSQVLALTG